MDRFPDSLIAFQRMFPHDDASVRWPEGFDARAAVMITAGRYAQGPHVRVRALPSPDLGDGGDHPARQQARAHRLVLPT